MTDYKHSSIDRMKEQLVLEGWYEYHLDDEPPTDEDALEALMDECGMDRDGYCHLAATEYCDFECPFRDD